MQRKPGDSEHGPCWHFDYCDPLHLPEDRVVRVRFLVNGGASVIAVILLIILGWQLVASRSAASQVRFWEETVAAHRRESDELKLVSRDYTAESNRIRDVCEAMRQPPVCSSFLINIGRTLPERMTADMISMSEGSVIIRGSLAEPAERASRVLGRYLESLRANPDVGPLFADISAPSLERAKDDSSFTFEIVLKLR